MSTPTIRSRKLDHINLAMKNRDNRIVDPGWRTVRLNPVALPGLDLGDVNLASEFLGFPLAAPIIIAGMTGGHEDTETINANLAIAAAECGIAMGIGSQRAALSDASLVQSYAVVRRHAPSAFVCGNIGISQLVDSPLETSDIFRLIDMVQANAMAVHVNVLQELVQPEGKITLSQAIPAIEDFIARCPVPVIVKETGCGMDGKTARRSPERRWCCGTGCGWCRWHQFCADRRDTGSACRGCAENPVVRYVCRLGAAECHLTAATGQSRSAADCYGWLAKRFGCCKIIGIGCCHCRYWQSDARCRYRGS